MLGLTIFISPNCLVDRTFSSRILIPEKPVKPKIPAKIYRNPVIVAKEYKAMIDSGQAKNQSDLARFLGVSRVRVCQILSLLKMDKKKIQEIEKMGEYWEKPLVTERKLRKWMDK